MGKPIRGDGGAGRWYVATGPDGVDRVYRRSILRGNDAARGVDDGEAIIGIHSAMHKGESLSSGHLGVDVEQRQLELVPRTKRLDA